MIITGEIRRLFVFVVKISEYRFRRHRRHSFDCGKLLDACCFDRFYSQERVKQRALALFSDAGDGIEHGV